MARRFRSLGFSQVLAVSAKLDHILGRANRANHGRSSESLGEKLMDLTERHLQGGFRLTWAFFCHFRP